MSSQFAPFRFRDLPKEIRDKIYRELLCDFHPQSTTTMLSQMLDSPVRALHSIDTAILRTSTTVYREAYEVMVKTNRFVKVTSACGLPIHLMLNGQRVPVVAAKKTTVNSFVGYVLAVHLDTKKPIHNANGSESRRLVVQRTMMILHRDMDAFCTALMDGGAFSPGFTAALQITMAVAPVLTGSQPKRYTPSFMDFFSNTIQKTLLAPFRTILRGLKSVKIEGPVDEEIATAVQADIYQDLCSDPNQILADLAAAKEDGSRFFKQRKSEDAVLAWQDAAVEVEKMVESSSWSKVIQRGGHRFINELSELYFVVRLNSAHVWLNDMQTSGPQLVYYAGIMAEDNLNSATKSLKKDYWMKDYKYRPSLQLLTKLRYRYALLMRLQREPGTAERALRYIDGALQDQPGDPAIMRERDNIVAWLQRGF
jgi:hypothetical protein